MRKLTSKKFRLLALVAILGLYTPPTHAAVDQNITIPVSGLITNPCTGETFAFSGALHLLVHVTSDGSGGFHVGVHDNASGITGVGLTTGTKLTGTEADNFTLNFTNGALNETATSQFQMISPGPGNNFVVHSVFHITIDANGNLTALVDHFTATCR